MASLLVNVLLALDASVIILLFLWRFAFLRNPERKIPPGNVIVSPADGKVIKITKYDSKAVKLRKGRLGKITARASDVASSGYIVSIFMSPLDVHINRAPIEGKVVYARHYPGKFAMAFDFEKSLENERTEMLIAGKKMKVKLFQVAGFLARRIECFASAGDKLGKGQPIGLINLGSQATLIMPRNIRIKVREGDRVKAGQDVLATYN